MCWPMIGSTMMGRSLSGDPLELRHLGLLELVERHVVPGGHLARVGLDGAVRPGPTARAGRIAKPERVSYASSSPSRLSGPSATPSSSWSSRSPPFERRLARVESAARERPLPGVAPQRRRPARDEERGLAVVVRGHHERDRSRTQRRIGVSGGARSARGCAGACRGGRPSTRRAIAPLYSHEPGVAGGRPGGGRPRLATAPWDALRMAPP